MAIPSAPACGARNGFAEHREARGAGATHAVGQALQRTGDRQHGGGHLDAAKDCVIGGNEEIAGQREFEAAAECQAAHDGDGRHAKRFDGAIGSIHFGDEGAEPVDVLAGPLPDFAAQAEVRTFRAHDQHPDVALACGVHRLAQQPTKTGDRDG